MRGGVYLRIGKFHLPRQRVEVAQIHHLDTFIAHVGNKTLFPNPTLKTRDIQSFEVSPRI